MYKVALLALSGLVLLAAQGTAGSLHGVRFRRTFRLNSSLDDTGSEDLFCCTGDGGVQLRTGPGVRGASIAYRGNRATRLGHWDDGNSGSGARECSWEVA